MSLKSEIINGIIEIEGGYSNDQDDSGGETMWGITSRVARANGWTGPMAQLPREVAFDIYAAKYWDALNLDEVELLSPAVAREMADTGVNMHPFKAATYLQRALNVLNMRGKVYPDLKVDGDVGPVTLSALHAHLEHRQDSTVLLRMLNALQGAAYISLAERREKDEKFIFGWFMARVV